MHAHPRRAEPPHCYGFLDPQQNVVPRAVLIVAEVVIQAKVRNATTLKKRAGRHRPSRRYPPWRRIAFVVEEYLHDALDRLANVLTSSCEGPQLPSERSTEGPSDATATSR